MSRSYLVGIVVIYLLSACSSSKDLSFLPDSETQKDQSLPRWSREVVSIFGVDRGPAPPLPLIPTRLVRQKKGQSLKPENPQVDFRNLAACAANYEKQWNGFEASIGTKGVLRNLGREGDNGWPTCWSLDQREEVIRLETTIQKNLDQLRLRTELKQLNQALSGGDANLKVYNDETRNILIELGRAYQEIQEDLSFCRLKDFTEGRVQPVSGNADPILTSEDRALLHVVGDVFGRSSGLEGQSDEEVQALLVRRLAVIRSLSNLLQRKSYILSNDQAEPCRDILGGYHPEDDGRGVPLNDFKVPDLQIVLSHGEDALRLMAAYSQNLESFHREFVRQLDGLRRAGDWFYFMGGVKDHSVIYKVIKEQGTTFQFRIYNSEDSSTNTLDGLVYHASIVEGSMKRVFPFMEKRAIPQDSLTRLSFLKALQDLKIRSSSSISVPVIYKTVLRELHGNLSTRQAELNDFLDPQLANTESYYLLPYSEENAIENPKLNLHLEFFVKTKIFNTYFGVNEFRLQQFKPAHLLASQSLAFYSEEIAKNLSVYPGKIGRYLDWGMARESQGRIATYRRILNSVTLAHEAQRVLSAPQYRAQSLQNLGDAPGNFGSQARLTPIERLQQQLGSIQALSAENWVPHAAQLNQDLETFLARMKPTTELSSSDRPREVSTILEGVQEIVKKIPLQEGFFASLSSDSLLALLGQLNDLTQVHFWALVSYKLNNSTSFDSNDPSDATKNWTFDLPPVSILAQVKLLTLADLLIHHYGSRVGEVPSRFRNFPSLYDSLLKALVIDQSEDQWTSYLTIQDHSWSFHFRELASYWRYRATLSKLFQWENIPLFAVSKVSDHYQRHLFKNSQDMSSSHWSQPYGNPDREKMKWGDIAWAYDYLKDVHHGTQPTLENVIASLDKDNSTLPPAFFEIRDISFLTHYILGGSFHPQVLKQNFDDFSKDIQYFGLNHRDRLSKPISFHYLPEPPPPLVPPYPGYQHVPLNHFTNTYRIFSNPRRGWTGWLKVPSSDEAVKWRLVPFKNQTDLYVGDPTYSFELSGERAHLGAWTQIIEARNQFYTDLNVPIPYYRRMSSSEIVSQLQITHNVPLKENSSKTYVAAITTLEMQRQLLNLGSPLVTLGFFREHPELLREKRWQILFKSLIFQPELLLKEFEKTPSLPRLLSDFCWFNFEKKFRQEDYFNSAFFVRMHQLLQEFAEKAGRQRQWPQGRVARDAYKRLLRVLPAVSDTKNLLFRDLLRTYRFQNFSDLPAASQIEDTALFIEAALYRDLHPLQEVTNFEADEENAVFGLYMRKRESLTRFVTALPENQRNQILNRVLQIFGHDLEGRSWIVSGQNSLIWESRLASLTENVICLDLGRPLIWVDQHEEKPLPGNISSHPLFKKLVRWNPNQPYATWLGGSRYELIDESRHYFRIDAKAGRKNNFVIEKKWGNYWYQLLSDADVNTKVKASANAGVFPGYQNWQLIHHGNDRDGRVSPPAYSNEEGLEINSWNALSPDRGYEEILTIDPTDGKLFSVSRYRVSTGSVWDFDSESPIQNQIVQKVRYQGNEAKIYGTTLHADLSRFEFLKRIELPNFIYVWKDRRQHIESIDLPRYGVRFHPETLRPNEHFNAHAILDADSHLVSTELDGYRLSWNQAFPAESEKLGHFEHFIVLEKEGSVRVAVPRMEFRKSESGLQVNYDLKWFERSKSEEHLKPNPIDFYARNSQRLMVWSVDPFDRKLVLPEAEDRYYLALIHLWGHSAEYDAYERARDLLYGNRSELGDFRSILSSSHSSGAREVLEWIVNASNWDQDPRAVALKMGAASLVIENDLANHRYKTTEQANSEFFESEKQTLTSLYSFYLRIRDRISTRWYPEDLERLYLEVRKRFSTEADPIVLARWSELRGEAGPSVNISSGTGMKGETVSWPSPYQYWDGSWDDYTEVNKLQVAEINSNCPRRSNLYEGVPASFDEMYPVSAGLDQADSIRGELVRLLSRLLGVSESSLHSYSSAQLKEEYLSYLRLLLRQDPTRCRDSIVFLYALADCPGNRELFRTHSVDSILGEVNRQKVNETKEDRARRKKDYASRIRAARLFDVNWGNLNQSDIQNVQLASGHSNPRSAYYWDPRTNLNSQFGIQFEYHRDSQGDDARYDLQQASIISRSDLESFVRERSLNHSESNEIRQISHDLQEIFRVPTLESFYPEGHANRDEFIDRRLSEFRKQIQCKMEADLGQFSNECQTNPSDSVLSTEQQSEVRRQFGKPKKVYEWAERGQGTSAMEALRAYRPTLVALSERTLGEARNLEAQLKQEIRQLPTDSWKLVKEQIFQEAKVEETATLDKVLHAFAAGAFHRVFDLNPGLDLSQAHALYKKVVSYLIRSTYYFRVEETIRGLDQLLDNPVPQEMERFYSVATGLRSYSIAEHPDYLVFEHQMRMMIREDQVRNLEHLKGDQTVFLEMIMGAGKTSVLLPLASRKNAVSNQKLSVVVLPEALLPSMIKQLNTQLEKVFGSGVDRLTIARKDRFDLLKIQHLYARLRKDLETERVVVTSNSSMQSLFLIFIEKIQSFKDLMSPEKEFVRNQEIAALQDIFSLFRNYGYAVLDEVDSLLDIMASHRFSLGKAKKIEQTVRDATVGLYQLLVESTEIRRLVKIPFLTEQFANARPFSKEAYDQEVKRRLIEFVIDPQNAGYFFEDSGRIERFRDLGTEQLRNYFLSTQNEGTQGYLRTIQDEEIKDVLSVLYTQIHQIFPMTLNKTYLVHYGLCPMSLEAAESTDGSGRAACHPFISIPYHSGTPVVTSRFGTDLESLNYTVQAHIEKQNALELFKIEMNALKKEFARYRTDSIRNQIAFYFGDQLSDGRILNLSDEEIAAQSAVISTQPTKVLKLVKHQALKKIETFQDQLFTNSYIYQYLFKKIQGMTGTLWNYESYPYFGQINLFSDSFARTLSALWKTAITRDVQVVEGPEVSDSVSQILTKLLDGNGARTAQGQGKALSIIDQGGVFRGRSNQDVVQSMLQFEEGTPRSYFQMGIPQLIFYDSDHQIQLMTGHAGGQTVKPYVADETNRVKRGAFWDMSHTTGSDLKVNRQNMALLTMNKFSIMRDLLQSAWRLRDLEQGQSVVLSVSKDDLQIMSKVLTEVYGAHQAISQNANTVPLDKILLYLATNEAIKVGEVNYRSVRGSQKAVVIDSIFNTLVRPNTLGDDFFVAFNQVKGFFSNPRGDHPYERYGIPIGRIETEPFLREEIKNFMAPLLKVFKSLDHLTQKFEMALKAKGSSLRRYVETVLHHHDATQEEMEIETETEYETETEVQQVIAFTPPAIDPGYRKEVIRWNPDRFFGGDLLNHPTLGSELSGVKWRVDQLQSLSPVISLRDVLELGGFGQFAADFDPKIFGSLNLFPVFRADTPSDREFIPFGVYQGLMDYLLVTLNDNESLHSVVLLTRDEALSVLGELFIQDSAGAVSKMAGGRSALIYQFGNGFIRSTGNFLRAHGGIEQIDRAYQIVEADPEFQRILPQVKFLSGRVNYSESESEALSHWLTQSGHRTELSQFFKTKILEYLATTQESFEHSRMKEILH